MTIKSKIQLIILIFIFLQTYCNNIKAAENIFLYKGTFSRTISVNDLENLIKEGKTTKKLERVMKLANQNKEQLYKILNYEIEIPITIGSKLLYSSIGETILSRLSKIMYPNKYQKTKIGVIAMRSALLTGSAKNNGKLNVIGFFKSYPNKDLAINLNYLSNTLTKMDSLTNLIKFYSNSPLEKLKEGRSKT